MLELMNFLFDAEVIEIIVSKLSYYILTITNRNSAYSYYYHYSFNKNNFSKLLVDIKKIIKYA